MIQSIEEGRKEDGNRSIADKIIKRLHDLDKTVENNQGRWAWELLQNAKDSVADDNQRTVSIQIELHDNKVEFRHNGSHFTEQDVRGLINQISSKEIEEGHETKKTGRFGTGFLTTHLLSKIIQVKGVLETTNKEFYCFEFPLNREGSTTSQLIPKIENAWEEFHNSTKLINNTYQSDNFNSSFSYQLDTPKQKQIARIGINEFIKLIPYVLCFISKIDKVEIFDHISNEQICFENNLNNSEENIKSILKTVNNLKSEIHILFAKDEKVSVAIELEKTFNGYNIKNIKDIPKIFCDFPLIGTENFHFPVIINSFFFNPQTERDGVWLKGDDIEIQENQRIFENAVNLYKSLLDEISSTTFFETYNMVESKIPITDERYFDRNWYKEKIQKPIREIILDTKIVELEDNFEKKSIRELWFPYKSYSNEVQLQIWQFIYDLFPHLVSKKNHSISWSNLVWDEEHKLTFDSLANTISKRENINKLSTQLRKENKETYYWLNSCCDFLLKEESNQNLTEKYLITPNQNGEFKKKSDLFIDEIEDETLINILILLGEDWKDKLLHKWILFGEYSSKNKKDIAVKITEMVNDKLKDISKINEDFVEAINLLSEWFEYNQELGKDLFAELYRRKAELFMNTIEDKDSLYKVMRSKTDLAKLSMVAQAIDDNPQLLYSIEKTEELSNLLREFNVTDISELKRMLLLGQGIITDNSIEITQDILVSLGVASLEELELALKDKDLAKMYNHTSYPNVDMFIYVQKLITRTKNNIIKHLHTLPEYDCSELEELANTVIGGIKKNGLSIHIVLRPSDNGEVIVYYSSEKDTLDYANAELWIDNGINEPRHLTLGKILKTTGINKIPV